jgi:hypothetical protein
MLFIGLFIQRGYHFNGILVQNFTTSVFFYLSSSKFLRVRLRKSHTQEVLNGLWLAMLLECLFVNDFVCYYFLGCFALRQHQTKNFSLLLLILQLMLGLLNQGWTDILPKTAFRKNAESLLTPFCQIFSPKKLLWYNMSKMLLLSLKHHFRSQFLIVKD